MGAQAIYLGFGKGPDTAIEQGLLEAGCEVRTVYSVPEAFTALKMTISHDNAFGMANTILVAEVQAGAIPLLSLIHEVNLTLPPTLLYDREGTNVHTAIQALKLGAHDYVLFSEADDARKLRARVLAERIMTAHDNAVKGAPQTGTYTPAPAPVRSTSINFKWVPDTNIIYFDDSYVRLTPVEGRVFAMLLAKHNQTVSMEELIKFALQMPNKSIDSGVRLLRPHMMRLRGKLEVHPQVAHRIVNVRGDGYMFT